MSDHLLSRMDAQADHHPPLILNESPPSEEQPNPDSIELFVGRIPKEWDEQVLTQFFEEFGPVYDIRLIRDRVTNESKGICFLTFFSRQVAVAAQNALNGIKTLPGMYNPMQVKPANSKSTHKKRKLFVGNLSRKFDKNNLRAMFSSFGDIESCIVLKDGYGLSKGCGFVIFDREQDAKNAINFMNQSQTMDDCTLPLIVKYAHTPKEKHITRQNEMLFNTFNSINFGTSAPNNLPGTSTDTFSNPTLPPCPHNFEQQYGTGKSYDMGIQLNDEVYMPVPNSLDCPTAGPSFAKSKTDSITSRFTTPSASTICQNLSAQVSLPNEPGLNTVTLQNFAMPATSTSVSSAGQLMRSTNMSANSITSVSNSSSVANLPLAVNSQLFINPFCSDSNIKYGDFNQFPKLQSFEHFQSFPQQTPPRENRIEGPEGANLSIYHLPSEYTDYDLAQDFLPFGNVISANVCFHKNKHFSICFGFVSYDDPAAALFAINIMNGMLIGTKRLIVRLNEPSKGTSKSY